MANILITSGAKFKPFSFDEYIKPHQMYTEAYNDLEDKYSELETRANVYKRAAEQNPNSEIAKMYQSFSNDLKAHADTLAETGKIDRAALNEMKARYATDIVPIEEAYKNYQEFNKGRRAMKSKDNSIIFTNEPTIDDFLNGNSPEDDYISTKDLSKNLAMDISLESRQALAEYLQQGMSYDEALSKISSGNSERINSVINRYTTDPRYQMTNNRDRAEVSNAINTGISVGLTDIFKENTLTRSQQLAIDHQRRQENISLAREARLEKQARMNENLKLFNSGAMYDENGNLVLNPNSPKGQKLMLEARKQVHKDANGKIMFVTSGKARAMNNDGTWGVEDDTALSATELGKQITYNELTEEDKQYLINAYQIEPKYLPDLLKAIEIYKNPNTSWFGNNAKFVVKEKLKRTYKQSESELAQAAAAGLIINTNDERSTSSTPNSDNNSSEKQEQSTQSNQDSERNDKAYDGKD